MTLPRTPSFRLDGRRALVAGASPGIGRAAAVALADPERRAWILSKTKLGRLGDVGDIMSAVVFPASDSSALVTGTSLLTDGGWTSG